MSRNISPQLEEQIRDVLRDHDRRHAGVGSTAYKIIEIILSVDANTRWFIAKDLLAWVEAHPEDEGATIEFISAYVTKLEEAL